jgi:RNA polymerase sigma-70 factor, ECF subfamily
MDNGARQAAERVARNSYGKLLSILAARSRDITAAEDALADAFAAALHAWPNQGVPTNPDAWLLTSARNALLNMQRHSTIQKTAAEEIERQYHARVSENRSFSDERLKLLFVCAHPSIDVNVRTALMLQTVLGIDSATIANAFLLSPAAMGRRLVRAKAKIRDAGIKFEIPDSDKFEGRLPHVLDAIYAAFGTGWDQIASESGKLTGLTNEAIYLARLLVELLPDQPEAKGLLALMLYCEARKAARRNHNGQFVPLKQQNAKLWNRDMIIEAEQLLGQAAVAQTFDRYQCEAAIQSVHVQYPITGQTNVAALQTLYQMLAAYSPTIGVLVAQATVLLEQGDPATALEYLERIRNPAKETYQPYWVAKAFGLSAVGAKSKASIAMDRAIGLTEDPAIKTYLGSKRLD